VKRRLVLATRSSGKLRELRQLLANADYAVCDLGDMGVAESATEEDLEHFETFEENALAKGRYFASLTGLAVLADDSGLEVAALGGRPGVRSKRWSGRTDITGDELDRANNLLLLESLALATDRRARYVCAAAFVDADREVVRRGIVTGQITRDARGDSGFGYDPYFESDELRRTFGEVGGSEKATVSHRARAVRALIEAIECG
jgi:XTP/dITP diphosphohydrolase